MGADFDDDDGIAMVITHLHNDNEPEPSCIMVIMNPAISAYHGDMTASLGVNCKTLPCSKLDIETLEDNKGYRGVLRKANNNDSSITRAMKITGGIIHNSVRHKSIPKDHVMFPM